jgi:hypothetical protein
LAFVLGVMLFSCSLADFKKNKLQLNSQEWDDADEQIAKLKLHMKKGEDILPEEPGEQKDSTTIADIMQLIKHYKT